MRHEWTEVAVPGGGAGVALAWELAQRGHRVALLDRSDGIASTLLNQKWKHSGLLYQQRELAERMWAAFRGQHPLERRHLLARGACFLARSAETLALRAAMWKEWGIPFAPLTGRPGPASEALSAPAAAGGFATPDSVIDFPALLPELRRETERLGTWMLNGVTVRRLVREGDRVSGVVYERDGEEIFLHCEHCVLALGGWAPEILAGIGVALPVRRWKSHIVTLEGELVERITAWLDPPGLTLVPYRGTTLVADTRRLPAADGSDRGAVSESVEVLLADLATCFPRLDPRKVRVLAARGCIKTEADLSGTGRRNHDLALFDTAFHGVQGLTVVFPGKASLMFALAREVADTVAEGRLHELPLVERIPAGEALVGSRR